MIVVNIVAFYWEMSCPEQVPPFMLSIGDGIHPVQWLTNNFLHADTMHLLNNMVFLWSFGLVVEGKLGLVKTFLVYIGIGIIYGAITQILMLNSTPTYCLGASAVIFGFMSMCLIWAPENCLTCFYCYGFRFGFGFYDVSIKFFVGVFLLLQILFLVITGGRLSSEFLHMVGAVVGLAAGIMLLKTGHVDCEHWDIFSVWTGQHKMTDIERIKYEAEKPEVKRRKTEQIRKRKDMLFNEIRLAIKEGNPLPAWVIAQKMLREFPDWQIPEPEHLRIIQLLLAKKNLAESVEAMKEYLAHYSSKSPVIRLTLAQIFVEQKRPNSAIKVLAQIDSDTLDDQQLRVFHTLREKVKTTKNTPTKELNIYELVEE
jgi:membrane associated rhomboid family serine protease